MWCIPKGRKQLLVVRAREQSVAMSSFQKQQTPHVLVNATALCTEERTTSPQHKRPTPQPPGSATQSISATPFPDARCYSSPPSASEHTSDPRTQSKRPSLKKINLKSALHSTSGPGVKKKNKMQEKSSIHSPKSKGPFASTILPCVLPWNKIGSLPGPSQYANVQTACADLFSKPARRR